MQGDSCFVQTSAVDATQYRPSHVAVRAKCEEGTSCLEISSPSVAFLAGKFCPKGLKEHFSNCSLADHEKCGKFLTSVYTRSGLSGKDELFMEKGSCPWSPNLGSEIWVLRDGAESDYMDPKTGLVELRGKAVACIKDDIEENVFANGSHASTVYMANDAFADPWYAVFQQQTTLSQLKIEASLIAQSCDPPEAESVDMTFGTVEELGEYSLNACECFGKAYRDSSPVTMESRSAVMENGNGEYNLYQPEPQLIFEGPFVCEDDAVLVNGQKSELSQDECRSECVAKGASCSFFMYVPQLRFCQLLQKCDQIGQTGLDVMHELYGVLPAREYCRVADPEACWISTKRRGLLEGLSKDASKQCMFESLLERCDAMTMITTESHGECKRCEYFSAESDAAQGRSKVPLPSTFRGASQLSVGCSTDVRLLDSKTGKQMDSSILTCVDGAWRDVHGGNMETLSCSACVQVAQHSFTELLQMSMPEVYFLSRRQVQTHGGFSSGGCQAASLATSSPLRNVGTQQCLGYCNWKWFFGQDHSLRFSTPTLEGSCLFAYLDSPDVLISWAPCEEVLRVSGCSTRASCQAALE